MNNFVIREIGRDRAVDLIQSTHYSKVMPRLTKHFLGCFLEDRLVGAVTLGWGTQPKATIIKMFTGLDTKDYYEIRENISRSKRLELEKKIEDAKLKNSSDWDIKYK